LIDFEKKFLPISFKLLLCMCCYDKPPEAEVDINSTCLRPGTILFLRNRLEKANSHLLMKLSITFLT